MGNSKRNLIKGSATIVVIFAALTASIYMISTFADYEHLKKQTSGYDKMLNEKYDTKNKEEAINNYLNKIKDIYKQDAVL